MDGWSDDTPSHESASHGIAPILPEIEASVRANWPEMREKYGSLRDLGGFEEFKRLCNGKDSTAKNIIFREIATDCMKHNDDEGWNLLMLLFRPAVKAYAELKYKYFRELGDADTWTHILCGIVRGVGTAVEKGLDYTVACTKIRSAVKDENRKLNRINMIRMREKIRERVTREEQSKNDSWKMREREMLFWGERMEFLRRHLRLEDWEVLYERLGEPQQSRKEYTKQHGISNAAAKKRLTRAKDRAAKLLMENGTDTNGI